MPADRDEAPRAARLPRRRIAKGPPRPLYLANHDLDRLMIMMVAHVSETLALRERLDTLELILARDGAVSQSAIEAFEPGEEVEQRREERRLATLRRIFRVLGDEFESYRDGIGEERQP